MTGKGGAEQSTGGEGQELLMYSAVGRTAAVARGACTLRRRGAGPGARANPVCAQPRGGPIAGQSARAAGHAFVSPRSRVAEGRGT